MKKLVTLALSLSAICLWISTPDTVQAANGEELFIQHCNVCHPSGGNIINPQKTLYKGEREVNKVNTEEAIISKMRNPGPGMSKFDGNFLSDSNAKLIAEYILKKF